MTTLIGIKAGKGKEGAIMASDSSKTTTSIDDQGDVIYRQLTKSETQKIYVDNDRKFAVSMSGIYDLPYMDFLTNMLNGKIDIEKVLKEGYFKELHELNDMRWDGRTPNTNINSLLIASRFDNRPSLYTCWPLGRVEERYWTAVGSGSKFANEYIRKKEMELLIPKGISLDEGIRLADSSIKEASQDIYTGGIDMIVVTAEKIREFGKSIKDSANDAHEKMLNKIIKECL